MFHVKLLWPWSSLCYIIRNGKNDLQIPEKNKKQKIIYNCYYISFVKELSSPSHWKTWRPFLFLMSCFVLTCEKFYSTLLKLCIYLESVSAFPNLIKLFRHTSWNQFSANECRRQVVDNPLVLQDVHCTHVWWWMPGCYLICHSFTGVWITYLSTLIKWNRCLKFKVIIPFLFVQVKYYR